MESLVSIQIIFYSTRDYEILSIPTRGEKDTEDTVSTREDAGSLTR